MSAPNYIFSQTCKTLLELTEMLKNNPNLLKFVQAVYRNFEAAKT